MWIRGIDGVWHQGLHPYLVFWLVLVIQFQVLPSPTSRMEFITFGGLDESQVHIKSEKGRKSWIKPAWKVLSLRFSLESGSPNGQETPSAKAVRAESVTDKMSVSTTPCLFACQEREAAWCSAMQHKAVPVNHHRFIWFSNSMLFIWFSP